jgi:hypothetical protein
MNNDTKKLEDIYESLQLSPLDYYGDLIIENNIKSYDSNCPNRAIISESSLTRLLSFANQKHKTFAIISAYRKVFSKKQNILRNRQLRAIFNNKKMGVYNLVGHWQECQLLDSNGDPVPYKKCPKNQLIDVIERSYFVVKPDDMPQEEFENILKDAMTIDNHTQDGVAMRDVDGIYKIMDKTGERFEIGTNLTVGKIAQAYSQHVKKINTPFVFEGLEIPNGSPMSYQIWNVFKENFHYILPEDLKNSHER